MANRWGNNGNSDRVYFLGLQQNHCGCYSSHEIKRCLLLGKKAKTNLDSILKSRDITLPTKVHTVKAMVFPVVTYRCESQIIKKGECRKIDAFELWCWRRLLRVPWTARRSNQSVFFFFPKEYILVPIGFSLFFFSFIFISWRLITLQYCSGFCHTLTWISHGFTCIPHPDPPSHLPLYPIPLGLPSAPGPSTCLMHPTWAGDLFHYR